MHFTYLIYTAPAAGSQVQRDRRNKVDGPGSCEIWCRAYFHTCFLWTHRQRSFKTDRLSSWNGFFWWRMCWTMAHVDVPYMNLINCVRLEGSCLRSLPGLCNHVPGYLIANHGAWIQNSCRYFQLIVKSLLLFWKVHLGGHSSFLQVSVINGQGSIITGNIVHSRFFIPYCKTVSYHAIKALICVQMKHEPFQFVNQISKQHRSPFNLQQFN